MALSIHRHNPERDAVEAIYGKLCQLDHSEDRCETLPLSEQELAWDREIIGRARIWPILETHAGKRELLLAIGALCVAGLVALDAGELMDVASGDEAA